MSLAATMEEARKKAIAETEIVIPKDDGLLLVYALLLDKLDKKHSSPQSNGAPDASCEIEPSAAAELAITVQKIRELRIGVYDLVDTVIARMAETAPPPLAPRSDRVTQVLAAVAAFFSLATFLTLIVFQLVDI